MSNTTTTTTTTSIMDAFFQRSLDDLIKGIRLYTPDATNSATLSTFISKALQEIRREIKSTDPLTKSNALLKLTYLNSFYFSDMTWASFHIVETLGFSQFSVKKIGYLAAMASFSDSTDVILLVVNQFKKDLSSSNEFEVGLALNCLAVIGTTDLCRELCNDVFVLLASSRIFVRKKAVAVVLRVFRKYPDAVRVCFKRLVDNLGSGGDESALCAVVGVFCELASREPKAYLPLAPEFYRVLVECKNNWVLIKVLKIFAKLAPLEPRLGKRVVDPICEIMTRTMAKSLVYECVRTVVSSLSDCERAVKLAVEKIREFLSEDDPNLKYLGLQALSDLAVTHSWALMENKEAVIKSLSDIDPNIKLASLRLLMAMVSEDNVAEITKVLVNYALKSDPEFCNEILRSILATCSKNYYEIVFDFDWYVLLLGDMSRIPHCQTGEEIESQLVDIGMRVKDARQELVSVARDLLIDPALLGNPYLHKILSAAAWVSGEYIEFSKHPYELMQALLQPRTNLLPPSIRAVYIQSAFKVLVFCLQSHLGHEEEVEFDPKSGFQLSERLDLAESNQFPVPSINDSDPSVEKNGNGVAKQRQDLVGMLLNLSESALGPLSWDHNVEVQERARNVLGIIELVKEAVFVSVLDEDNSRNNEAENLEITKLIYDMFSEEIGPVSTNAQAKIALPDGLILKDDLSDLDAIYGDLLLDPPTSFSLVTPQSKGMETETLSKEDMQSSTKSESLLSQHRKRHDLYYLSPDKDGTTATDYPPANDSNVVENEVNALVKLTEQTLIPKKKRNLAKSRPVVVKLDEGESFIPAKKQELAEDLLSGAVKEILTNNAEVSTSSRFGEATQQSYIRKGKEKVTNSLGNRIDNLENVEIGNPSSKRSNRKSHSKEKKQLVQGENDDGKEERSRKEKKKSSRHSRHKSQRKQGDSNIAVKTLETSLSWPVE